MSERERVTSLPITVKPGERYTMTNHFGAMTLVEHVTVVETEQHGVWLRIDAVDVSFNEDELTWLGSVHQCKLIPIES